MQRGGSPRKTQAEKELAGTARPSRAVVDFLGRTPSPDEEPVKPEWLSQLAAQLWDQKVATYKKRGQPVAGFEDALAQYVTVEALLITAWQSGTAPGINLIKEHRAMAGEFYDTPAAQKVSVQEVAKSDNPFVKLLLKEREP